MIPIDEEKAAASSLTGEDTDTTGTVNEKETASQAHAAATSAHGDDAGSTTPRDVYLDIEAQGVCPSLTIHRKTRKTDHIPGRHWRRESREPQDRR